MAKRKAGKSWNEMSGGERKAVLVGWAAIVVLAGWLLLPSNDEEVAPSDTAVMSIEPVMMPEAIYQTASPEALASAKQYLQELDQAMIDSIAVLKTGELQGQHDQSKYFGAQVEKGQSLFGVTIFEPLGRCFAAGNHARAWWHAQLAAARKGGTETAPGSIKDALAAYRVSSSECLKDADPVASAQAQAEQDAELRERFGGGRECLITYDVDPATKQVFAKPRPAHCKS